MEPLDTYAPPKANVIEIDTEPARIPGLFKAMLVAFFVLEALGILLGRSVGGIVWIGVMAIAAWHTLEGNRAASRVLGCFLALNVLLALVAAASAFRHSMIAGTICVALAIYVGILAAYIFLNPAMQAVFGKADSKKWSGG
jgi:hypothetical protein